MKKKRSASYPSKTLFESKNFVVSVFDAVGDAQPLKYNDLAKYGKVPAREADSFASTATQYGWLIPFRGEGHKPKADICKVLRNPLDGDDILAYKNAFLSPPLYKSIIADNNGKELKIEGLIIYLIRTHDFSDPGAKTCATIFIENAKFLGLIDDSNNFNIESNIDLSIPEQKPKVVKSGQGKISSKSKEPKAQQKEEIKPPITNSSLKNITVFIRGKELSIQVFNDMTKSDWDQLIKQLQNLKEFSRA
jgi:hypothetical protein